ARPTPTAAQAPTTLKPRPTKRSTRANDSNRNRADNGRSGNAEDAKNRKANGEPTNLITEVPLPTRNGTSILTQPTVSPKTGLKQARRTSLTDQAGRLVPCQCSIDTVRSRVTDRFLSGPAARTGDFAHTVLMRTWGPGRERGVP